MLGGTALAVGGTLTQADIDAGSVSYVHDGSEGTTDGFGFTVSDGVAVSAAQTFSITLNPVNDPPVVTLPATVAGDEDTPIAITGVSIADPDAATGQLPATLPVSSGTLTVGTPAGPAAGPGLHTRGVGAGGVGPHQHLAPTGLRHRHVTMDQNLPGRAEALVPDSLHHTFLFICFSLSLVIWLRARSSTSKRRPWKTKT